MADVKTVLHNRLQSAFSPYRRLRDRLYSQFNFNPLGHEKGCRIIGVDGGLSGSGVAEVVKGPQRTEVTLQRSFITDRDQSLESRLERLFMECRDAFKDRWFRLPTGLVIESMSYPRNSASSAKLSGGRSILFSSILDCIDPISWIAVRPNGIARYFGDQGKDREVIKQKTKERTLDYFGLQEKSFPDNQSHAQHIYDALGLVQYVIERGSDLQWTTTRNHRQGEYPV